MKAILSALFLTFFLNCVTAQIPEIVWQNHIGGTSNDNLRGSVINFNKGLMIIGSSISSDIYCIDNHGLEDYFVANLDSNGTILWTKSYGGSGLDMGYDIIRTDDSCFLLVGQAESTDGDVSPSYNATNVWVVKIDTNGTIQWEKSYGGSGYDAGRAITATMDGNFMIASVTTSSDGDVTGLHAIGDYDIWLTKIDPEGNLLWQNCFGGTLEDRPNDIICLPDSSYAVIGWANSNNFDVGGGGGWGGAGGGADLWCFSLAFDHTFLWTYTFGGPNSEFGYSLSTVEDSIIFIAGETYSTTVPGFLGGLKDGVLIKLSLLGDEIDHILIGGTQADKINCVTSESINEIIISGNSKSVDVFFDENNGYNDFFLIKLDSNLNVSSAISFGGEYEEGAPVHIRLGVDRYYFMGSSQSEGLDIEGNYGLNDYWICKLAPCDTKYFQDFDNDGFGDIDSDTIACNPPIGYVTDSTDCNDTNPDIHPLLSDICNSIDDNCNGLTDEDATFITYYIDADGDTYGDPFIDSTSCSMLIGFVENDLDCNDADAAINPDAIEICNGIDDNCNALIDDGLTMYTFFADVDGDTYGDPSISIDTCAEVVTDFVSNNFDCDDTNASIYSGAEEICNYLDDDCDGVIDDNIAYVWQYQDADNDLYGNLEVDTLACLDIPGYVPDSTDCNDLNPDIYPGATEILNGLDDDCDGQSDEGLDIVESIVNQLEIYPNPTEGICYIKYEDCQNMSIAIRKIDGSLVYRKAAVSTGTIEINMVQYAVGIYTVELQCESDLKIGRIVKQ